MRIFGKTVGEYVEFSAGALVFVLVIGALRFGLYQAGAKDWQVRWLSMTGAAVLSVLYLGVRTHTSGFGSYRQLLPQVVLVLFAANALVASGIAYAMWMGADTIFTLPELSGPGHPEGKTLRHALAHLFVAPVAAGLLGWGIGSLTLTVARLLWRGPAREAPPAATPEPVLEAAPPSEVEPTAAPPSSEQSAAVEQ